MEKLKFEEIIDICSKFVEDPSDENTKNLNTLESNLTIRPYLPMEHKVVCIHNMMIDTSMMPTEAPAAIFTIKMEIACCFRGLFAYTNIDMSSVAPIMLTYEAYDAVYQSGLADYILQYCSRDYDRLCRLVERSLSYENLLELVESVSRMDTEALKEVSDEFKAFRAETDPQILKDIADIVRYNDPALYELKEDVLDSAIDKILRADDIEKVDKK